MYKILKDSDDRFIWDEQKGIMYQMSKDGDAEIIKANLEQLSRFRPNLEVVEIVEKLPKK